MKREDYITWDQYFMGIAIMSAERSKDPGTQVGACIVGSDNRILSMGYNGMPAGIVRPANTADNKSPPEWRECHPAGPRQAETPR